MNIPLLTKKNPSCAWPDNLYRTYMNGRLKKIDMTARLNHMKNGLANKSWYPEWDARQRGAAQRILNNALDVLDEYDY